MPCDYKIYPKNWKTEIVPAILRRAGEVRNNEKVITKEAHCEWCGVKNHTVFCKIDNEPETEAIHAGGNFYLCPDGFKRMTGKTGRWKLRKIVLTIAHLDHDAENHNVSYERLKALCQKCHNTYDMPNRAKNRKNSLKEKKKIKELFE